MSGGDEILRYPNTARVIEKRADSPLDEAELVGLDPEERQLAKRFPATWRRMRAERARRTT